jgi:hypothetical protein
MTKHGWGPVWELTLDGKIEQVRAPTDDELWGLELELDAWHEAHPDTMPPLLWAKLQRLIGWQLRQSAWSREEIQTGHWWAVDTASKRMPLKRAFKYAEDFLRGTPLQAGYETMRKDYYEIEKRRRG